MYSVEEIYQNIEYFDYWDFRIGFRVNAQIIWFNTDRIDEVFTGEYISLRKAIDQKKTLQCFIEIGKELGGNFITIGSVSVTWKAEENECYIGTLWIEPDFRGNGVATYLLNEIINFGDKMGIILTLHALPFIDPEKKPKDEEISKLKAFYQQFGFKEKLETKGIGFDCSMERFPKICK